MKNRFKIFAVLALATVSSGTVYAKNTAPTFTVSAANRPAEDVARDAIRKPAEMVKFAMVKPGQTVVDMLPGGGYFTRKTETTINSEHWLPWAGIALCFGAHARTSWRRCASLTDLASFRHPEFVSA